MKLFFSTEAESDLLKYANYLNIETPSLVEDFLDKVRYTTGLLLNMPDMGTPIKSLINTSSISEEILNASPLLKEDLNN